MNCFDIYIHNRYFSTNIYIHRLLNYYYYFLIYERVTKLIKGSFSLFSESSLEFSS